jgi:hypothetical protein
MLTCKLSAAERNLCDFSWWWDGVLQFDHDYYYSELYTKLEAKGF